MRGVRSGGRLARAVLPQHSQSRTCPPEALRMSGIPARRAPRRSARRSFRQSCSLGCSQHVLGGWVACCCNVTCVPIPAWSRRGCQQCLSGAQALAAWTLANVLPCWSGPGGAARPLVRICRATALVRSYKLNIYRRKTSEILIYVGARKGRREKISFSR